MRAIRVHEYGDSEVLKLDEVSIPQPGPGTLLIKLEAVGVNFIDIYKRTGVYKGELPFIPGEEGAGIVEAVGDGVTHFKKGDRVAYAMVAGAYAEYAVVPESKTVHVPDGVSAQQAAAALLQGMTAHYLSHSTYPLKASDTALVHAAGGGTGQLLVQMAKKLGARVIGTASSEEKIALARAAGADEVIQYTHANFEAETKLLTNGKGVDVVYDSVGVDTFEKSLNCLHPRGYMVLFGQSSGVVPPLNPQILNAKGSLFLTRPSLGHYVLNREELDWRANDLFSWMVKGELRVTIDKVFPLEQAGAAHDYLGGRQSKGKILLSV